MGCSLRARFRLRRCGAFRGGRVSRDSCPLLDRHPLLLDRHPLWGAALLATTPQFPTRWLVVRRARRSGLRRAAVTMWRCAFMVRHRPGAIRHTGPGIWPGLIAHSCGRSGQGRRRIVRLQARLGAAVAHRPRWSVTA